MFLSRTAKGYITVEVLRDILHELDNKISAADLDLMIDEIDADGSGTVDFEGNFSLFYSLALAKTIWIFETYAIGPMDKFYWIQ